MKKLVLVVSIWFLLVGICSAQSFELALDAGSKSVSAGAHFRNNLGQNGYLKAGISGIYTDDDDIEYKWGAIKVAAGNDSVVPGLTCEIGLKGIVGEAEAGPLSSDVGALAFTIHVGYLFGKRAVPIPIEIFSDLTYAPDPLTFNDTEDFVEGSVGVGVHLIKNAALTLTYTAYDIDFENVPNWTLDEDVIRAGIVMRF